VTFLAVVLGMIAWLAGIGSGSEVDANPRVLLVSARDAFKRNRGRFSRGDDGRWSMGEV
jgi:hypothetical protein